MIMIYFFKEVYLSKDDVHTERNILKKYLRRNENQNTKKASICYLDIIIMRRQLVHLNRTCLSRLSITKVN